MPKLLSDGQFVAVEVVCLPAESVVVVVYWHPGVQLTFVLVAPLTVAVRVVDEPTMMTVPAEEVTETLTTFAVLLLPQPLRNARHKPAKAPAKNFVLFTNVFTPASRIPTHPALRSR
jgi:hypothetical protein